MDLDGRTWEGLCRMLSEMRLHIFGGVVLPGFLVIRGCKMVCPNQLYIHANVGGSVRGRQGRGCTCCLWAKHKFLLFCATVLFCIAVVCSYVVLSFCSSGKEVGPVMQSFMYAHFVRAG